MKKLGEKGGSIKKPLELKRVKGEEVCEGGCLRLVVGLSGRIRADWCFPINVASLRVSHSLLIRPGPSAFMARQPTPNKQLKQTAGN